MLIAFVLLGRNLEQRAKIRAASDMTGLLSILPSKARLVVDGDTELGSTVEIPCSSLSIGDEVIVLPGVSQMNTSSKAHLIDVFTLLQLLLTDMSFLLAYYIRAKLHLNNLHRIIPSLAVLHCLNL